VVRTEHEGHGAARASVGLPREFNPMTQFDLLAISMLFASMESGT
jgi:hypothetical protein